MARDDEIGTILAALREKERIVPVARIVAGEVAVPKAPGVYAWYFEPLKLGIRSGYYEVLADGLALLYSGSVPGRMGSRGNLRERLRNHLKNTARQSSLRLSLGALLLDKLSLEPRKRSDGRVDFGGTEGILSGWIARHGAVSWVCGSDPWKMEASLVKSLGVPLNLHGNEGHPFFHVLASARAHVREKAGLLTAERGTGE